MKTAAHREIVQRYKRRKRRSPVSFAALRVADLSKLFRARYGATLPNDDAGRDDLELIAHHLAQLSGDPRRRIIGWVREHASWLPVEELDQLLAEAIVKPKHWKADQLAWRLRLIEADRAALKITTIGAVDMSKSERTKRRKAKDKQRKAERRRARGVKPRAQYLATSKSRAKPWKSMKMSRAAWYRAGQPAA